MRTLLLDVIAGPMILLGLWPIWVLILILVVVTAVIVHRRKKK